MQILAAESKASRKTARTATILVVALGITSVVATAAVLFAARAVASEPPRPFDTSAPLWALVIVLSVAVIVAFIALIARNDPAIVADAARVAVVVIPVAALADAFAYLFNLGWANSFSIPWRLVPWQGSFLTVVVEAVITFIVLMVVARAGLSADDDESHGKSLENESSQARRTEADKKNDSDGEFGRERIRAVVPLERRAHAGVSIIVIGFASFIAGCYRVSVPSSWSYIDKECVIVAVFGDTVIAADVEGGGRVATDFTIYHADSVPPYWQSERPLGAVVSPDSEIYKKRLIECPRPVEPKTSVHSTEPPKPAHP